MSLPLPTPPTSEHIWDFRAFREFPWQNGLVLHGSGIEQELLRWLEDEPTRHTDVDRVLLKVSPC